MVAIDSCLSNSLFSRTQEGCSEWERRQEEQDRNSHDQGGDGLNLEAGINYLSGSKERSTNEEEELPSIIPIQLVDFEATVKG